MNYVYPVVFTPDDGGYCVYAPDLPGCITQARDYADGIENIRDGIGGILYILERDGRPIPAPSVPADVEHNDGDTITLVDVDVEAYRRRVATAAVRRTISIPQWMDEMASRSGVSLSQITQDGLRRHLGI